MAAVWQVPLQGLWCGVAVWCGVVWCGVVLQGVVWWGVVWRGVVWLLLLLLLAFCCVCCSLAEGAASCKRTVKSQQPASQPGRGLDMPATLLLDSHGITHHPYTHNHNHAADGQCRHLLLPLHHPSSSGCLRPQQVSEEAAAQVGAVLSRRRNAR